MHTEHLNRTGKII